MIKMCNFSFIKFSQKLGVLDLQNLVGALREPMLLNKVLCMHGIDIDTMLNAI